MVSAQNHHTFRNKLILLLGISVEPVKVTFECRTCGQVFDQTTDPAELAKGTR
jgi:hypothetical protein